MYISTHLVGGDFIGGEARDEAGADDGVDEVGARVELVDEDVLHGGHVGEGDGEAAGEALVRVGRQHALQLVAEQLVYVEPVEWMDKFTVS